MDMILKLLRYMIPFSTSSLLFIQWRWVLPGVRRQCYSHLEQRYVHSQGSNMSDLGVGKSLSSPRCKHYAEATNQFISWSGKTCFHLFGCHSYIRKGFGVRNSQAGDAEYQGTDGKWMFIALTSSDLVFKVEVLSKTIQKPAEDIARDINRPRYFDAWEAKDYGIIDQVCR